VCRCRYKISQPGGSRWRRCEACAARYWTPHRGAGWATSGSSARLRATGPTGPVDVDLLVAPGPRTTLFDLSGFALDVEEIVARHVDVATPRG
jgi:hypothetical protein